MYLGAKIVKKLENHELLAFKRTFNVFNVVLACCVDVTGLNVGGFAENVYFCGVNWLCRLLR